jgi:hypothetical protein
MWIFAQNMANTDAVHRSRSKETQDFLVKHPIQNFTKICPVAAKLVHADGWTNINDEANSSFFQFCESTIKEFRKGCHKFYVTHTVHILTFNTSTNKCT